MKLQDLGFILIYVFLLYKKKSQTFVFLGIFFILLSIPLFSQWIFFTAERLTWYAALFFLTAIVLKFYENRN